MREKAIKCYFTLWAVPKIRFKIIIAALQGHYNTAIIVRLFDLPSSEVKELLSIYFPGFEVTTVMASHLLDGGIFTIEWSDKDEADLF